MPRVSGDKPRIVICGAGVIGASIAYHLALRGVAATVVDRAGVAAAASGKSGGFLALDWCDGSPLGPLARQSFAMHARLAETLGPDCGYRTMTTLGVAASARGGVDADNASADAAWLDRLAYVSRAELARLDAELAERLLAGGQEWLRVHRARA